MRESASPDAACLSDTARGPAIGVLSAGTDRRPPAGRRVFGNRWRLWIDRSFTIKGAGPSSPARCPPEPSATARNCCSAPRCSRSGSAVCRRLASPPTRSPALPRVALNLRGVPADLPARGMALIEPGRWTLATELDVRITPPAADPNPKFPPELVLHIGAARSHARLRILGTVGPGIYARLRLRDPLPLHAGERVLLRDPGAAGLAIYGATVLDPAPPPLARRGAGAAAVRELSTWPDVPTAADLLGRHKLLRIAQLVAAGVDGAAPRRRGTGWRTRFTGQRCGPSSQPWWPTSAPGTRWPPACLPRRPALR